jgi:hypothetical protein
VHATVQTEEVRSIGLSDLWPRGLIQIERKKVAASCPGADPAADD